MRTIATVYIEDQGIASKYLPSRGIVPVDKKLTKVLLLKLQFIGQMRGTNVYLWAQDWHISVNVASKSLVISHFG
jgi:hypothetical protein